MIGILKDFIRLYGERAFTYLFFDAFVVCKQVVDVMLAKTDCNLWILQELNSLEPHENFRLWLTAETHPKFPTILLQTSLKVTYEVRDLLLALFHIESNYEGNVKLYIKIWKQLGINVRIWSFASTGSVHLLTKKTSAKQCFSLVVKSVFALFLLTFNSLSNLLGFKLFLAGSTRN